MIKSVRKIVKQRERRRDRNNSECNKMKEREIDRDLEKGNQVEKVNDR